MTKTTEGETQPEPSKDSESTGDTTSVLMDDSIIEFQQNVRQWFSALSPHERVAVLGFTDAAWMTLLSQVVGTVSLSVTEAAPPFAFGSPKTSHDTSNNLGKNIGNETPRGLTDKSDSASAPFYWETPICLDIIEKLWAAIRNEQMLNISGSDEEKDVRIAASEKTKGSARIVTTGNDAGSEMKLGMNVATSEDAPVYSKEAIKDSDAYRIHNIDVINNKSVDSPLSDTSAILNLPPGISGNDSAVDQAFENHPVAAKMRKKFDDETMPVSVNGYNTLTQMIHPHPKRETIVALMGNICTLFPSICQLANDNTIHTSTAGEPFSPPLSPSSHVPFITLHPTYIASISCEDLLSTFDDTMALAFVASEKMIRDVDEVPRSFIPADASSMSLLTLLKSYANTYPSAEVSSPSVPLFMLVLGQLQVSLIESYKVHSKCDKEPGDLMNSTETELRLRTRSLKSFFDELHGLHPSVRTAVESQISSFFPKATGGTDPPGQDFILPSLGIVMDRLGTVADKRETSSVLQSIDMEIEATVAAHGQLELNPNGFSQSPNKNICGESESIAEAFDLQQGLLGPSNSNGGGGGVSGGKKSKKKKRKKKKITNPDNSSSSDKYNGPRHSSKHLIIEAEQCDSKLIDSLTICQTEARKHVDAPTRSHDCNEESHTEIPKGDDKEINLSSEGMTTLGIIDRVSVEKEESSLTHHAVSKKENFLPVKIAEFSHEVGRRHVTREDQQWKLTVDVPKEGLNEFESSLSAQNPLQLENGDREEKDQSNTASTGSPSKTDIEDANENERSEKTHEDEQWETVGTRPRDRRKKNSASKSSTSQQPLNITTTSTQFIIKRRRRDAKQRMKARKVVKELLLSVLDTVEESVQKKSIRKDNLETPSSSAVPLQQVGNSNLQSNAKQGLQRKGANMRDILIGGANQTETQMTYSDRAKASKVKPLVSNASTSFSGKDTKISNRCSSKPTPVDQNTVPTIPETLSAAPLDRKTLSADSISGDSLEAQKSHSPSIVVTKEGSPSPPLPTLLSPGNMNSSSSSVASSLDAPHGSLPDPTEDEVGYHLLGVCNRLSNEISLFMKRRGDALSVRRYERELVLAALEESVGAIWPGICSVELYGSCATNLDLPSSDLDVVVRGLNRPMDMVQSPSNTTSSLSSIVDDDGTEGDEAMVQVLSQQDLSQYGSDSHHYSHQQIMMHHGMQMMYTPVSLNAERVMRLAMELEHQPWAVHVKAIPTATVPVIKILADPGRLSGPRGNGSDWLVHHAVPGQVVSDSSDAQGSNQSPIQHYPTGQAPPLWRGADVVNGLLKVDITFEGPEHGGIGSTEFSMKAVKKFAAETGLPPDSTPAVQVLMVLKELLAQRRLNEPFSGGLSSYALLLLVISVIRERSIIREELEKAERQRRVVAAGGGNSAVRSPEKNKKGKDQPPNSEDCRPKKDQKGGNEGDLIAKPENGQQLDKPPVSGSGNATKIAREPAATSKITVRGSSRSTAPTWKTHAGQSSWVSVARSNSISGSLQQKRLQERGAEATPEPSPSIINSSDRKSIKKPSSFADAVTKGVATPARSASSPSLKASRRTLEQPSHSVKSDSKTDDDKNCSNALPPQPAKQTDNLEKAKQTLIKNQRKEHIREGEQVPSQSSVSSPNPNRLSPSSNAGDLSGPDPSIFPQGFHDVVEVLCSGETTSGKLLMHFLLFYGQHFDSQSTAIDYSGTHLRDVNGNQGYSARSPYLQRRSAGNYDPVSGMLTVDPIVVYDPLKGAESNNVARSCFAWSSIRWLFAQSYMTLSSTVETNGSQGKGNRSTSKPTAEGPSYSHDQSGNVVVDPNSPLLELLLSY